MDELDAVLRMQIAAVDRRVGRNGPYAHESEEIRSAAAAVETLRQQLGLGRFVRSLTPPTGKPQLLLAFDGQHRGLVVLKIYGRVSPSEGAVQRAWTRAGVPCVPTLEHGDEPVSWLLMALVDGEPLTAPGNRDWDPLAITHQLAATMRSAHAHPCPPPASSPTLREGLLGHLQAVVGVLDEHGYRPPNRWERWAPTIYETGGRATLHGDLFPGNLLQEHRTGQLLLLDAPGYRGDPAFDMARWTVRVAQPDEFADVIAAWVEVEPLNPFISAGMLATECLMQAGVREIVKREHGQADLSFDVKTQQLLDAVPAHLADWMAKA